MSIGDWTHTSDCLGTTSLWATGGYASFIEMGYRPAGKDYNITSIGTNTDLFKGEAQLLRIGYTFHLHDTISGEYNHIASIKFDSEPDKDEVVQWAQCVARLANLTQP